MLNTLAKKDIQELIDAYNRLVKAGKKDEETLRFFEYLKKLTLQETPEDAYKTLIDRLNQIEKTVPTRPELEALEKERELREEARAEAKAVGEEQVADFIKQNQQRAAKAKKIQETLKDKIIYAKVEKPEAPKLTEQEQQVVEILKEAAKANPQQLIADLAAEIKTRIKIDDFLAKQAAFETVKNLVDPAALDETVILNQIAANPEITPIPMQEYATTVATPLIETYQTSREVVSSAFGENFAFHLLGPKELPQIKVALSAQPIGGGKPFNLQQIPQQYSQSLERQNTFVAEVKDFSQQEIKSQLLSKASVWLDSQVAKLPVESTLAKLYSSPKIQATLSLIGIGKPIEWVGVSAFGKIAVGTGFGPALGWLGKATGINFGVAEAVAKVAPAVGKGLAKVGASLLAKTGFAAIASKVITGLGVAAGWITGGLSLIAGLILGKIIEKIPWKKIAPYLAGLFIGIPTAIFLGPVVGIVAGVGTFALLGGIGVGGIGLGIARFFAGLGGAFVVTIGTPVIITLIAFPVVVALILFIINSGAYMVPPDSFSLYPENPYIEVPKTANPPGPFENNAVTPPSILKITYTITIIAKKGALSNIRIEHKCRVLAKSGESSCPAPLPSLLPTTISPTSPFVFTYEVEYSGNNYLDSLVLNTFTVTADAIEAKDQKATGSASVIIGDPPTDCFIIDGDWPASYRANMEAAVVYLVSGYNAYAAKVCTGQDELLLRYNSSSGGGLWGWYHGSYIDFYSPGLTSERNAKYILFHEAAHALSDRRPEIYMAYESYPGIQEEPYPYCFYDYAPWPYEERFAEAVSFYANDPCGDFQSRNPTHYQFVSKNVYN